MRRTGEQREVERDVPPSAVMVACELVVVVEAVEEDGSCGVDRLLVGVFDCEREVLVDGAAGSEEDGELEVGRDAV